MTISYIPFNITSQGIFLTNSGETRLVANDHPNFDRVKDAIKQGDWDQVWTLSDTLNDLKQAVEGTDFQVVDGLVTIDGEGLPATLSKRILAFVEENLPSQPLIAFWKNLRLNPSYRARKALFDFLDKQGHPLTEDGCFIAYKRVNSDFCSYHATPGGQHLSHKVGEHVEMPREQVDDDPSNTCSSGLHVANYNYAFSFYDSGRGYLLDVKVNPRDVVAIPLDYNGEKMRVCAYDVLAVAEGERVDEQLYKYEKPSLESVAEDESIWVGDIEVVNDLTIAYAAVSDLRDNYDYWCLWDEYYRKGQKKANTETQRGNVFNIIRERFNTMNDEEIAAWIVGYVENFVSDDVDFGL